MLFCLFTYEYSFFAFAKQQEKARTKTEPLAMNPIARPSMIVGGSVPTVSQMMPTMIRQAENTINEPWIRAKIKKETDSRPPNAQHLAMRATDSQHAKP